VIARRRVDADRLPASERLCIETDGDASLHIADMTMFYAPASGGVRTYLEAKHRRLQLYSGVRHSILVPGRDYSHNAGVYEVPAPVLPFGKGYRFPVRRAPWRNLLRSLRPDLIEVGDPYMTAWAALDAGRRLDVPVIGFYHSDLPLLVGNRLGHWLGANLNGYVARLYGSFDRVLAPSQAMASKLIALGVRNVYVQPLGVDLETFQPSRRDPGLREELGLADDTRLLIFAGRGSREKNLGVLLETARQLGADYHLLLVGSGSITHNLHDWHHYAQGGQAPYVLPFIQWVEQKLHADDVPALLDYRRQAPFAEQAHPTDEHLLPLHFAMGAAGTDRLGARRIDAGIDMGFLAMDIYRFDGAA